ncbi:hypothetical protein CENSYa_0778 [Cenarchaeum symbiosum A]|uniref:HTH HARE-type domain-containing protein n=1 Tax=Cenarchaeum symbiosum (strain A) TaxID=414004 RepID=A0RVP4_CENSY|nr:hypothetical protein CENSYa_0778 [Cenarchaeum symbiosum A]
MSKKPELSNKTGIILDTFEKITEGGSVDIMEIVKTHPSFKSMSETNIIKSIGKSIYSLNKDGRIKRVSPGVYKFVSKIPQNLPALRHKI